MCNAPCASRGSAKSFPNQEVTNLAQQCVVPFFSCDCLLATTMAELFAERGTPAAQHTANDVWMHCSSSLRCIALRNVFACSSSCVLTSLSAQHIANLRRCFATSMLPGQRVMGVRMQVAVFGLLEFSPQGLANTCQQFVTSGPEACAASEYMHRVWTASLTGLGA